MFRLPDPQNFERPGSQQFVGPLRQTKRLVVKRWIVADGCGRRQLRLRLSLPRGTTPERHDDSEEPERDARTRSVLTDLATDVYPSDPDSASESEIVP